MRSRQTVEAEEIQIKVFNASIIVLSFIRNLFIQIKDYIQTHGAILLLVALGRRAESLRVHNETYTPVIIP